MLDLDGDRIGGGALDLVRRSRMFQRLRHRVFELEKSKWGVC